MEQWAYFLEADTRLDLSRLDQAVRWVRAWVRLAADRLPDIARDRRYRTLIEIATKRPTRADRSRWARATNALRSLARRLHTFKGRPAKIDPGAADLVARAYIAMAIPVLQVGERAIREIV